MIRYITCNQNGSVNVWLDQPNRVDKLNIWKAKYLLVDSVLLDRAKQIVKDSGATWESEPIVINF